MGEILCKQTQLWGTSFDKVYYCIPSLSNSSQKDEKFFKNLQQNIKNFHLLNRLITKDDLYSVWHLGNFFCENVETFCFKLKHFRRKSVYRFGWYGRLHFFWSLGKRFVSQGKLKVKKYFFCEIKWKNSWFSYFRTP